MTPPLTWEKGPESSSVAIRRLKVKSMPPSSDEKLSGAAATLAARTCNFLCGLPLVNLQAAALINGVQAGVSQRRHRHINHADVSFLSARWPPARSQPNARRREDGGGGGGGIIRVSEPGVSSEEGLWILLVWERKRDNKQLQETEGGNKKLLLAKRPYCWEPETRVQGGGPLRLTS